MKAAALLAPSVGRSVERIEDERLLRGRGVFADDNHVPGLLHAAIFRSAVAHGHIRSLDVAAARALKGVHAVYTAADIAKGTDGRIQQIPLRLAAIPELERFGQPVLAHGKVRYVGEPLAIVVADTPAIAEDALELIEVDIDSVPAVLDRHTGQGHLFEDFGSNTAVTYTATKGDAGAAKGPYVRRETFRVQRHSAVCLEPRGVVAIWDEAGPKLTVLGAAKIPFPNRRMLAAHMDLPEECVDMIEGDVGGGFGVRGTYHPEEFLIPFAARRLRRPVKWIEDRRENLLNSNHAREVEVELEIVCERDGTILALRGEAWVNVGAYLRTSTAVPTRNMAQFMSGPYRIPNIQMKSSMVFSNKCPIGTYRGPGRFEPDFCRERLFDMAARDLGIDRVEFRRRNLPFPEDMPYPLATVSPPVKAEQLDSGDYNKTLQRCLAEIGWDKKSALRGKLVDGRYHGLGIGCFIEGGAAGPRENARMVLHPDGNVDVFVGSAKVGQSVETTSAQIAADALGVPMARIRMFTGSTTYLKEGFGSYHSRSTVMGGSAILNTARNLKAAIAAAAAKHAGCSPSEVEIGEGLAVSARGTAIPLAALGSDGVSVEGTFENPKHTHTYAYGAAAAHVAVDPRTGHVEVLEYVNVEDIGKIINPQTAAGQAVGGVVQGLGGVFLEHLQYDDEGQFLTASFADYLLPSATDFPFIKAIVLEDYPAPDNPLGAKGGGEGGIVPVGGVIANAIADALQSLKVEPRELPLSPPRVWELIQAQKAAQS
jgi:carbon-monoxide dehydrogenase large subunit